MWILALSLCVTKLGQFNQKYISFSGQSINRHNIYLPLGRCKKWCFRWRWNELKLKWLMPSPFWWKENCGKVSFIGNGCGKLVVTTAREQCDHREQNFATSANFYSLWAIVWGLIIIWQFFKPTFAELLCCWANFYCCKWPNVEELISLSGHTARELHFESFPSIISAIGNPSLYD